MTTATATPPPAPALNDQKRADLQRQVRDPLQRLRGTIKLYVSIEGAAVLVLYLALWFWIGLAVDYGFFRLFGVDWVEVMQGVRGLRVAILVVLLAGLLAFVAVKVILRLLFEFRDAALALVLERRFPKVLGDRLITAVELADPKQSATYGFSQAMVDQTIQEAAARVEQVPVNEVFNWGRLRRYGAVVVLLTAGVYLVCGLAFAGLSARGRAGDYFQHFNNVAAIWGERNLLLHNTYWPRQAHLEVIEFPAAPSRDELAQLKVGRDAVSVPLKVRAVKYVIFDPKVQGGWRALQWDELTKSLAGRTPPALLPGWSRDWTVDAVELRVGKEAGEMAPHIKKEWRDFFEHLQLRGQEVGMQRRMRYLEVPESVLITYEGEKRSSGEVPLTPDAGNDFSGNFTDLKESVRFRAVARDFRTAAARIIVVPPPGLAELYKEEARPAYLYHRPPIGGSLSDLKGLKQQLPRERVTLGADDTIHVPEGSDLTLVGVVDKDRPAGEEQTPLLVAVAIVPRKDVRGKTPPEAYQVPVKLAGDGKTFSVAFTNIRHRLDFDFDFTDSDGVVGRRHIVIEPEMDAAPELDVFVDVVRKTAQGYLITAQAMVPWSGPERAAGGGERFNGRVRDRRGLSDVQYNFNYSRVESQGVNRARAGLAVLALQLSPASDGPLPFLAGPYLAAVSWLVDPSAGVERTAEALTLPTFQQALQRADRGALPREQLAAQLKQPPKGRPVVMPEFIVDADSEFFDLLKYLPQLKETDRNSVQQRYRVRVWLTAVDNNIENAAGPRSAESKERFSFMIVSDTELLAEIGKETEGLHLKSEQVQNKLRDAQAKLRQVLLELDDPKFEDKFYSPLATRVLEISDVISSTSINVREVFNDFRRIVREEEVNRIEPGKINKDRRVVELLGIALDSGFVRAEEAGREFVKSLEAKDKSRTQAVAARDRLDDLVRQMQAAIDQMDGLVVIADLVKKLQKIEEEQRDNVDLLKYWKKKLEEEFLEGLLNPKKT